MPRFNAVFTSSSYTPLDPSGDFQVTGILSDNTGLFYYGDVAVGNVYYSNGTPVSYPLILIYQVLTVDVVDANANPVELSMTVRQTYPDVANNMAYEPQIEGIIGIPNESGIIQLPDMLTSGLNSDFLNGVRNYQFDLLNQSALTLGSGVIAPITGGTGGTSNRIYHAPYIGDIDGLNQTITTTDNFVANSTVVSVNGQRMILNRDYTETSPNLVNFLFTPQVDDLIIVDLTKV